MSDNDEIKKDQLVGRKNGRHVKIRHVKKRAMLLALEASLGIVTHAAAKVSIDRDTHYEWLKTDPDYKAAVDSIADIALDFAESRLLANIKEGLEASTIFYLKTKGKGRGYIERQEIENVNELPKRFNLIVRPDDETP